MSKKRHHKKRKEPTSAELGPVPSPEVPSPRRSPVRWAIAIGALAAIVWFGAPHIFRAETPTTPPPAPPRTTPAPTTPRPPASPHVRPARMTETPDAIDVRVPLSDAPAALRLVWIGDMRARVDACECRQNLRLPFVASLLRRLASGPPRTLLLDVGGAIDGDSPFDRARQDVYAAALKDLGFAALAVGGGRGYLSPEQSTALAAAGPPLLTLGGTPLTLPFGTRSVSFACVDSPPVVPQKRGPNPQPAPPWPAPAAPEQAASALAPLRARGDFVFLLGDLSREDADRIAALPQAPDVILAARGIVAGVILKDETRGIQYEDFMARSGRTWIFGLPLSSFGGVRWLEVAQDGSPVAYGMIQPSPKLASDTQVSERVEAFMRRLETDPSLTARPPRRFASEPRENDASDAYVGADACIRCHAKQGTQWRSTPHSYATKELEQIDRHYDPSCITCHSTGYGYPTGYSPKGEPKRALRDVGCETCHGPGRLHSETPKDKALLRRGSSTLCLECHDGRDAKPLGEGLEKAYERIRH